MSDKYILDGHNPVPARSLMEWTNWFVENQALRRVAEDTVGEVKISTVFLGIDYSFDSSGPPTLFETMIFGGPHNQWQKRCATWDEAEAIHARAVKLVRGGETP